MKIWIKQVCPKCFGSGEYDRGENIISPCLTCNGDKSISTDLYVDIGNMKDKIDSIYDKVITL